MIMPRRIDKMARCTTQQNHEYSDSQRDRLGHGFAVVLSSGCSVLTIQSAEIEIGATAMKTFCATSATPIRPFVAYKS